MIQQQEQQQPQREESAYNYYNQYNPEVLDSFLRWQFDIEDIVEEIGHSLKGSHRDSKGEWQDVADMQLMNDRGVAKMMILFRSHIGKLFLLGNFTEENENQLMFDYVTAIEEDLFYHYIDYEINPKNFEFIKTILEAQALACIRSGRDAKRATLLVSSFKTNEMIEHNRDKGRGLFGLMGWGNSSNNQ